MRPCAALAFCIGLLGTSISCGGDNDYTATSPDATDLRVVQVWDESAGLYSEGARSYIRIETVAEEQLVERELEPTAAGAEATIKLDPGDYRLVSWQRPCDGSCDSLDEPTERAIVDALDELQAFGTTIVIVAHRPETMARCDPIHVLEEGRLVRSGSHSELLGQLRNVGEAG